MSNIKYPTNYDFGNNWKIKIVPHLDNSLIAKSIKKGINAYLGNFPMSNTKFKEGIVPATYSSVDYHATLMDRKIEIKMAELRKANLLPKVFLELEKLQQELIDEGDVDNEIWIDIMDMQDKIIKPFTLWKTTKYDLESYHVCGACHFWAPTFQLTLAKLVEPTEKWKVRVGDDHTTVINADHTKVFDLLYWAIDDRLENYLFGDKIPKKRMDKTLGGKQAFINSA